MPIITAGRLNVVWANRLSDPVGCLLDPTDIPPLAVV